MTFSLHQATAMTDKQAANNQSHTLNVNGDSAVDVASDTEQEKSASNFSTLFSLFNREQENSQVGSNSAHKKTLEGEREGVMLTGLADSPVGELAVDGTAVDSVDVDVDVDVDSIAADATAVDNIANALPNDSLPQAESNDDFLARLDQSSMLLQSNVGVDAKPSALNQVNGNKLPAMAEETNIASTLPVGVPESSVAKSDLVERGMANDELSPILPADEDPLAVSNPLAALTLAGMPVNNQAALPGKGLVGDELVGDKPIGHSASDVAGKLADDTLETTAKFNLSSAFGETAIAKNSSIGQVNTMAAGSVNAATSDSSSTSDMSAMTAIESTEPLDFAQIMESARKQESLEQAPRTQAKVAGLTEAEQQVLDKRVNLNNNLASSELNEKIAIMAGKELQTATIRLDPAELGSMNIKLVVQNDQINVTIQAQNNQSRELLEQQMPRLREMLQQQGMTLGDTQVQADSGQQQSGFGQSRQENGQKDSNNEANYAIESQSEVPVTTQYWQDSTKGVDFYA